MINRKILGIYYLSLRENLFLHPRIGLVFKMFFNNRFRRQCYHLYGLLSTCTWETQFKSLRLSDIEYSHDPLVPHSNEFCKAALEGRLPPLQVIYDRSIDKYIVKDGNHRLKVLKANYKATKQVKVIEFL